jgi:hypothetical protein
MMPSHMPEHACASGRLAAVEANLVLARQPLAAEVGHGDGEADAGAGWALEDHRERLAGKDRVVPAGLLSCF